MINYFEWSMEYKKYCRQHSGCYRQTQSRKKRQIGNQQKELDLKIAKYKIYYNECIHISNHLMDRYYGV